MTIYKILLYFNSPNLNDKIKNISNLTLFFQITFSMWFFESTFYAGHRLLHNKNLYSLVHKQHHKFKGSKGFAAEFAHPFETLFANIIPFFGGAILAKTHPLTLLAIIFYNFHETFEGN